MVKGLAVLNLDVLNWEWLTLPDNNPTYHLFSSKESRQYASENQYF